MKNILAIDAPLSNGATERLALQLARQLESRVTIGTWADTVLAADLVSLLTVGETDDIETDPLLTAHNDDVPVTQVCIKDLSTDQLAALVNQEQVDMVIAHAGSVNGVINLQTLLNKINVPLLLIPNGWDLHPVQKVAYMTDMRYCRVDILSCLSKTIMPTGADVYVAHMAASGLPDMSSDFLRDVFESVARKGSWSRSLFMHHIRSQDPTRVADVLINGLKNDMLVLVNHSAIYKHFIGPAMHVKDPELLHVPLLLFPN